MNFSWNIYRDWGKAAWLKRAQTHDGECGSHWICSEAFIAEKLPCRSFPFIPTESSQSEDGEEMQEAKGNKMY